MRGEGANVDLSVGEDKNVKFFCMKKGWTRSE